MKILALTRYGRQGASSRMRLYQYVPWLEAAEIEVTISPLFSDAYVAGLQRGHKPLREVLVAYPKRIQALLNSQLFDLVWIEKEALPWLPVGLERALLPNGIPYVLDYDDAVFHYYDGNRNPIVRCLLGKKHRALVRQAALVVVGNDYLANFASVAGAHHVEILPTVVDLRLYPKPNFVCSPYDSLPCVGWIGQRTTASFLSFLSPVFKLLAYQGYAQFAAVGIDTACLGLPMASFPWTEQTEVASISGFDIGIMPLVDGQFERGKCGYKLIQYMACGLPVVASPVGVNRQIVEHGVNGFLAETPADWEFALRTLAVDQALRKKMGAAGRKKVEELYCLQVTAPKMVALFQSILNRQ